MCFEHTTQRVETSCSIQLSYKRIVTVLFSAYPLHNSNMLTRYSTIRMRLCACYMVILCRLGGQTYYCIVLLGLIGRGEYYPPVIAGCFKAVNQQSSKLPLFILLLGRLAHLLGYLVGVLTVHSTILLLPSDQLEQFLSITHAVFLPCTLGLVILQLDYLIWCASPQSRTVIVRIMSSLHYPYAREAYL